MVRLRMNAKRVLPMKYDDAREALSMRYVRARRPLLIRLAVDAKKDSNLSLVCFAVTIMMGEFQSPNSSLTLLGVLLHWTQRHPEH